ncbi:inositol monophosphatase [Gammaproteobacteria bacterium]|jgi:myo-inositol-1(or 4)-monophosphatase|nr:inositol monophosphatase [Gammaproteobacteria bacterium]
MHPTVNIALRAAREASDIIVQAFDRLDRVKVFEKGANDYVTNIDQEVEELIKTAIQKAYPEHSFLGEETGLIEGEDKDTTWIIDPIDGTRNFMRGFPHFCISMACVKNNKVEHAVILDPIRQDEFTATRGEGSRLNDSRIRVGTKDRLQDAVISMSYASGEHYDSALALQAKLQNKIAGLRFTGSAALDLAYAASARLDAGWMSGIKQWDVAAGILLVQEAGGLISDHQGNPDCLQSDKLVFANAKCFKPLLKVLHN